MDRRSFLQQAFAGGALTTTMRHKLRAQSDASEFPLDIAAANRKLANHRIVSIESRRVRDRFPRSVGPNAKGRPVGRGGSNKARIVTTDGGVTGWCLGGGQKIDPTPFIGTKVGDMFDVERGISPCVPQWLDKTLHDLAARILELPVWKMLGARGNREVWLYSGAIYMDDVVPADRPAGVEAVLRACRQDYRAGYRAFKLKIGRGAKWMERRAGLERDILVTHEVRNAFPDCRILVDANDSYDVDEAAKYITAVADCDLYWIEEAFQENVDDYRRFREALDRVDCDAFIADGEARRERAGNNPTRFGDYSAAFVDRMFHLAEEKLVDIFVMDLDIVGYSRWRRVMPELVAAGITASPHAWMWCLRTHHTAQLAGGVGNIPIVEGIPGTTGGVDTSNYTMRDGKLVLPDSPGFGLELEPEL